MFCVCFVLNCGEAVELWAVETHNIRDPGMSLLAKVQRLGISGHGIIRGSSPGPYCPDTGKAQMTCKGWAVVLVIEKLSSEREEIGNGGITSFAMAGELRVARASIYI